MSDGHVKDLQAEMNAFFRDHRGLGYAPLRVDGETGQLTRKRVEAIKYLIGYARKDINDTANDNFLHRMRHPNDTQNDWGQTRKVVNLGKRRRVNRRAWVARNHVKAVMKSGVATFDGRPVASCAVPLLKWARQNGWHGQLVSGWRDPKYSRSLCLNMCGRPSCPGKCAGMTSNHVGNSPQRFAMDVSDYANFGRVIARCPLKPRVHNSLGARDPVHFSPAGN